jgi:hypothetical protein
MVRVATLATVQYMPGQVPSNPGDLPRYLTEELQKIKAAMDALALGHIDVTHIAPPKPRDGDIRLCDGVDWDPLGTGQKFVGYRGGAWVELG